MGGACAAGLSDPRLQNTHGYLSWEPVSEGSDDYEFKWKVEPKQLDISKMKAKIDEGNEIAKECGNKNVAKIKAKLMEEWCSSVNVEISSKKLKMNIIGEGSGAPGSKDAAVVFCRFYDAGFGC